MIDRPSYASRWMNSRHSIVPPSFPSSAKISRAVHQHRNLDVPSEDKRGASAEEPYFKLTPPSCSCRGECNQELLFLKTCEEDIHLTTILSIHSNVSRPTPLLYYGWRACRSEDRDLDRQRKQKDCPKTSQLPHRSTLPGPLMHHHGCLVHSMSYQLVHGRKYAYLDK